MNVLTLVICLLGGILMIVFLMIIIIYQLGKEKARFAAFVEQARKDVSGMTNLDLKLKYRDLRAKGAGLSKKERVVFSLVKERMSEKKLPLTSLPHL